MASDVDVGEVLDPKALQTSLENRSLSAEEERMPLHLNKHHKHHSSEHHKEKCDSKPSPSISVYDTLKLGLLMTLIFKICKNIKVAVVTTICVTTFLNGFDTTSDSYMVVFYFSQGLTVLAVIVIASDYISGLIVLFHHINSQEWEKSTPKDKVFAVVILGCHPFSLVVTHIMWLMKISDHQRHRLARISAVLHGGIEAPMQFLIFVYAFSQGILPLPWAQSTSVADRNGNVLYLGKISIFSLILTLVSLLKSAMETFEIESFVDQMWAAIYALLNMAFRILGIGFIVIYLEKFSLPFFVFMFAVIYLTLMCQREKTKEFTSTVSTMAVALFLPISISRSPEQFQIKDRVTDENEIRENKTKTQIRVIKATNIPIMEKNCFFVPM